MRFVSADELDDVLDFPSLITALSDAFAGNIAAPPRHHHTKSNADRADQTVLLMPAWDDRIITTKLVCVTPDNGARGLPAVMANVVVQDALTGTPLAVLDGARLTLWRTAAASGLAASHLAPNDAATLLMVGSGALAPFLVNAHRSVRAIERVMVWNRNEAGAQALASRLRDSGMDAMAVSDLDAAVGQADVISAATLSTVPLIRGARLSPATHVDLVGAFTPLMRETDDACIQRSALFVDTRAGALKEGGDLVQPINAGLISETDIKGDLRELVLGTVAGRTDDSDVTLFKSTGASLEDLAAARLVCDRLGLL